LLAAAWGRSRAELALALVRGESVPLEAGERFAALVERREAREPLQHLTGRAGFRRLELLVGPGVFVPRPETEVVVEAALGLGRELLAELAGTRSLRVLDLCSGSGAIGLSIAHELPGAQVGLVELDPDALGWLERNRRNLVESQAVAPGLVRVVAADVLAATAPWLQSMLGWSLVISAADADADAGTDEPPRIPGAVDLVVANPPYIPDWAVPVEPEVAQYDPARALYGGGANGLEVPTQVLRLGTRLLRDGGALVMEHGSEQGPALRAAAAGLGYGPLDTGRDLTGRERYLRARYWVDGPPSGRMAR
jgi:release factor glutamine methyltransferase